MASRKKTTSRKPTKPARGGSSGGANPRNDGEITEQQHDEAMRVLRAEYYRGVRSIAHEIRDRIKDGEIQNQDDLETHLNQSIDGSYWVIYTHANFQVLICSDHHDEYTEQFGEPPVRDNEIQWNSLAFAAMERDVRDQMDAEGIGIEERELEERQPARRAVRRPAAPARRRH